MRRSRVLVSASWVVATAVATLISAAGVSIVTRDVTDDQSPSLGAADVIALLGTDVRTPVVAPATAPQTSLPPSTTDTATSAVPPSGHAVGAAPTAAPSPPSVAAEPPPDSPSSAFESSPIGTFASAGGVIAVACSGDDISLVSARPNHDYQVTVQKNGPRRVVVTFGSNERDKERSTTACVSGAPTLIDRDDHGGRADERDKRGDRNHERDNGRDDDRSDREGRGTSKGRGGDRSGHGRRGD